MPESAGTLPEWPPRPMPLPRWQPPRRPAGPVDGRHDNAPPAARTVDGWPAGLGGSAPGRPPRRQALLLLLGGGVLLLLAVAVTVTAVTRQSPDGAAPTVPPGRTAAPPASGSSARPGEEANLRSGSGYRLAIPAGWRDRTPELGRRVARVPADLVLTGQVTQGFVATITVVRAEGGSRQVPLSQVRASVGAEVRRLREARLVGSPRAAAVAGARGIRYDFVFVAGDGQVRGSQVVVDRGDDRYFVTYEARPGAFDAHLFTDVLRGWQWR